MPVDVILEEPALFFMRAFGIVTVDEVAEAVAGILADPRLAAGAPLLIDNRDVTSIRTVAEVAVITSAFAKLFASGVRSVAVVTEREQEASRVFASFSSTVGANVKVFREEVAARAWLASTT
jgi:hypothetical protein